MDVHIYIGVTDLEHGIAFYTQGLGLRLRRRLRPNWVELEGASVPYLLVGVKQTTGLRRTMDRASRLLSSTTSMPPSSRPRMPAQ